MKKLLLLITIVFFFAESKAQLTPPTALQSYYNDVDFTLTGTQLFDDLATVTISKHTNYLNYSNIWDASKITDENPQNSNDVLLIYGFNDNDGNYITDRTRNKSLNGGSDGTDWNREHTFPNSRANPSLDTNGQNSPPYAEAFNLRPSDVKMNSNRGNLKFATGTGNAGEISGNWYPGDEWKGDAARIIMYMYLRYGDQCLPSLTTNGTTNSVDDNMINLLLDWNAEDPVSSIEIKRNDYHGNSNNNFAQGNRNPFIDNPYLATVIWGGTQATNRWGANPTADTEAPTVPTNITASNITATTVDLNWTASTDNIAVTSYNVYLNNNYYVSTNSDATNITVANLSSETEYTFAVLAADLANNTSELSSSINATTLTASSVGESCVFETFENMPANESSYSERTWTGNNNIQWTAVRARTDQTLNSRAIAFDARDDKNGSLTSSSFSNGIGSLTASTKRAFSGGSGTLNVLVNGNIVGTLPYDDSIQTTTISNINISEDAIIVINETTSGGDRVIIDDLSWTCFSTLSTQNTIKDNFKIYPNPTTGNKVYFNLTKEVTINVYNVLGKLIKTEKANSSKNNIDIATLVKGVYLLKINTANETFTRKFIKN